MQTKSLIVCLRCIGHMKTVVNRRQSTNSKKFGQTLKSVGFRIPRKDHMIQHKQTLSVWPKPDMSCAYTRPFITVGTNTGLFSVDPTLLNFPLVDSWNIGSLEFPENSPSLLFLERTESCSQWLLKNKADGSPL